VRRLAVLLLATAAVAQDRYRDPFLDLFWRVGPDGEVRAWPDWRHGDAMEDTFEPRPLFPALAPKPSADDPEPERFADLFAHERKHLLLLALLSGPTDLASLCDAELHFRRLRMPLDAPFVWTRFAAPPRGETAALRRRAELDRILAVRIEGMLQDQFGTGTLEELAGSAGTDPFLRAAAEQTLARIRGTPTSRAEAWIPDGLPADCSFYATVDHRAIPPAPRMMRDVNGRHCLEARATFWSMGASYTMEDLLYAQWSLDRAAEFPYELARRFGNVAPRRTWVAFRRTPELSLAVHVDGLFETEPLRAAATELGASVEEEGKGVRVAHGEARLVVTPTTAELRMGPQRSLLSDAALAELKAAGLGGGDAVWIHVRDLPSLGIEDPDIRSATLRASFHAGVTATLRVACSDEGAATRLAERVREILARMADRKPPEGEPGVSVTELPHDPKERERLRSFLRSVDVRTDGPWVAVAFHQDGETPWSVFRALLEG